MKQISARTFRTSFATLEEPVTVILRGDDGYRVLGTWTPLGHYEPVMTATDTRALDKSRPGEPPEFGRSSRFGKPKAVPK